jgi:hypothetical protein
MEKEVKKLTASRKRKELETKFAAALKNDIKSLPPEYRKIMVDDLVSAFESRLSVLSRAQSNLDSMVVFENDVFAKTQ